MMRQKKSTSRKWSALHYLSRRTTEETLVLGSEVLIGQTVLESLDLQVDCTNHRVIGNPAHPDQPMIKIKFLWNAKCHG